MLIDRAHILPEKLTDLFLGKPKRFLLEENLDVHIALRGGIEDDLVHRLVRFRYPTPPSRLVGL